MHLAVISADFGKLLLSPFIETVFDGSLNLKNLRFLEIFSNFNKILIISCSKNWYWIYSVQYTEIELIPLSNSRHFSKTWWFNFFGENRVSVFILRLDQSWLFINQDIMCLKEVEYTTIGATRSNQFRGTLLYTVNCGILKTVYAAYTF